MSRVEWGDGEGSIPWSLWNNALQRHVRGPNGQSWLRQIEAALLALPNQRLIEGAICLDGEVCAVGAVILHKRMTQDGMERDAALADMERQYDSDIDLCETEQAARAFGMRRTMANALATANDEDCAGLSSESRYEYILQWVRERMADMQP